MIRTIALYTAQWGDLPLEDIARRARDWGADALELAPRGDHFDADRALESDRYLRDRRELLDRLRLRCVAVSAHSLGQCVCDHPLDERHRALIPPHVWGDGEPEGVHRRAAEGVMNTARAAALFGVPVVVGFTGSRIWNMVAGYPPIPAGTIEAGFRDFADRWNPILDVFDEVGVRFALEVHPTEIAFDFWTAGRALDAVTRRPAFGLNLDPSHLTWQMVDPVAFAHEYRDRIYHVHVKDTARRLDGRNGVLSSHLPFGDYRRGWDFVTPGRGDVAWERLIRALDAIGYPGPLSVEWEDNAMSRDQGARESIALLRRLQIEPPDIDFESPGRWT